MGRSLKLRAGGLREMPRVGSRGWLLSALPLVGEALFLRPCLRAGLAWPHLSRSGSFCFALGLPGASGAYAGGAILEVGFLPSPRLEFLLLSLCARSPGNLGPCGEVLGDDPRRRLARGPTGPSLLALRAAWGPVLRGGVIS